MSETSGTPSGTSTGTPAPPPPTGNTPQGDSGSAPQGTPQTPPASNDWTSGLPEDAKGYIQTKGFQNPGQVLDSYRNLEKLVGVPPERVLKLPDKEDDPNWANVWEKLGRPKDPKEYTLKDPEGGKLDPEFAEWAKSTFHELNLTKAQAERLSERLNQRALEKTKSHTEAYQAQVKEQETALRKEWGLAYEQNIGIGKRAALALGVDGETIDKLEQSMGFANTMKFFSNLGAKIGEDRFVTSTHTGGFGVMTPEAAQSQIRTLMQDSAFRADLAAGKAEAREKWDKLHQMAYVDPVQTA